MTGQIVETDLTEKDDVERALRDSLKKLTDMTSSKECIHFRSVDIGFPIPFLKVNFTHLNLKMLPSKHICMNSACVLI